MKAKVFEEAFGLVIRHDKVDGALLLSLVVVGKVRGVNFLGRLSGATIFVNYLFVLVFLFAYQRNLGISPMFGGDNRGPFILGLIKIVVLAVEFLHGVGSGIRNQYLISLSVRAGLVLELAAQLDVFRVLRLVELSQGVLDRGTFLLRLGGVIPLGGDENSFF